MVGTFLKLFVLKPNPRLSMPKSVKDWGSAINLTKCSQVGSLEKVSMPKTYRGSTIEDNSIVDEIIVVIFLDFPQS
jgi:hypothetical protein